jgi:4-amino-4-deoxy-L-arabinose transferase-like glycosyltransferase
VRVTEEKRQFPLCLLAACAAAFVLRLALALTSASGFVPQGDEGEYLQFADTLLHEGRFGVPPTAYRLPLYPMLLAAVQGLTGVKVPAYLVLNAFLGTAAVALIYFLCRRLVNVRAARISLFLSVPNPFLMTHSGDVLTENLYVPLVLAFLLTAVSASEDGEGSPWSRWAGAGALLGLCNLTRPTLLLFPFLLPACYLLLERRPGARTRGAVLAMAVTIFFLLPWWGRNCAAFGHFIPGTTGEGFVWLGCYNDKAFHDRAMRGAWVNYNTEIDDRPFQGKTEFERDRIASRIAREYAIAHAGEIPRVLPWKLMRTFHWRPHLVDREWLPGWVRSITPAWGFLFSFVLVFPLMLREGWMRRRERPFAVLLLLSFYFLLVVLATYGSRRMRLPVEGVMIVFAAAGWDRLAGKVHSASAQGTSGRVRR